ncbi:RidA family protein [Novosphingobium sp. P6W]|uniref:RidA family protein n=1 Tax=Novosphingobium sp. P6W TaxID=1609758 RepID=UPI0005C2FBE1|nr:RidA family protein [Novosphingobium sp. P6W]AXB78885.1 RidA family protein [Novosphingobium sp. P6W]KIS29572.1 endoribonuclease L-PSP [Novosphingobium sp. P6W]
MNSPPHLSPAMVAGDLLFLSGQLAFGPEGRIEGDISVQTRRCLERLENVLREHGLDRSAIVKVSVWLTDCSAFTVFNDAYAAFFGEQRPARSTVISGLAIDGALVEIDAVALLQAAS